MNQTSSKPKLTRRFIWIGVILITAFAIYSLVMSLSMSPAEETTTNLRMSPAKELPANLDYSTARLSDKGLFNVSYTPSTGTVPVNQMHQWTLHVEDAAGKPVEDATIAVDGDMPQHGHGLPTQPRVTKYLGNGDYLVDGMKFQMGGWWLMDFTITAGGQTDIVHFNMLLK